MTLPFLRKYNTFLAINFDGWREMTMASVGNEKFVFALANDGQTVRLVRYVDTPDKLLLASDRKIELATVATVAVEVPEHAKTVTRQDQMPVAVKANRSPVARTLVGAVLLGPVGALAGAASGLGGKTTVQYHAMEREETVTVKGDPRLVLTFDDATQLSILFEPAHMANHWHRLLTGK